MSGSRFRSLPRFRSFSKEPTTNELANHVNFFAGQLEQNFLEIDRAVSTDDLDTKTGFVVTTATVGDDSITSTQIADATITNTELNASVIANQTEITALDLTNDDFLFLDATDNSLKKAATGEVLDAVTGDVTFTVAGLASIASNSIVNADINSSAAIADSKLATISTAGKVDIGALEIDGASEMGAALVDADLFIVDDGAGGTEKSMLASRIPTYVFGKVSGDATVASNGALTIAAQAVENSMLADDAVGADELAANAVVTASIVDDNVTQAKIADDAVGADQLAASAVVTASIVDNNVTQAKIADDAVGADQLAASAVVTASIVDDNVTQAKIADDAVGADQLAANAVVNASISSGAAIADSKLDTISTADKVSIAALNIDGGTDIGAGLVDADLFIVDDGAGGTNRKTAASRIKTYVSDLTLTTAAQTAITSVGTLTGLAVNATGTNATLQYSGSGGNPCLTLDQDDVDAPVFTFLATEGSGGGNSIETGSVGSITKYVKVKVGTTVMYMPLYAAS